MTNSSDPVLGELVGQLAGMLPADRDAVLAGLDEAECARLMPLLDEGNAAAPSPALARLIQQCRTGTAQSVKPRVAATLIQMAPSRIASDFRPANPKVNSLRAWDRLSALWRGRS